MKKVTINTLVNNYASSVLSHEQWVEYAPLEIAHKIDYLVSMGFMEYANDTPKVAGKILATEFNECHV